MRTQFTSRLATESDVPALTTLMDAAILELQRAYLDDAQIAASRAVMGLDKQLIEDGTYFVVDLEGELAGCGGWSRRATPYGGSHEQARPQCQRSGCRSRSIRRCSDAVGPMTLNRSSDAEGSLPCFRA